MKLRTCYACGNQYKYCPNCADDEMKPHWMFLFDNEKCKDVFEIISAYGSKDATKEDVLKVLDKYEIKSFADCNDFNGDIRKILKEIFPVVDNTGYKKKK